MGRNISVMGSGSWGTAISVHLAQLGNNVKLWSYKKEESLEIDALRENRAFLPGVPLCSNIKCTSDAEYALMDAEIIVMATPSHGVRGVAKIMAPFYKENQIIVNISKGLEEKTYMRMTQVIKDEIKNATVSVLSGPSHAEEVSRGIPTANVIACSDIKIAEGIQDVFMGPAFRVYTNPDVAGVEMGGSLKNVIALCAGIVDGIGYGDNTKAALMTRGIYEISRLGVKMGADFETFFGLSGIGDLIVTCTSMHSRNRRCGILIGEGKSLEEATSEVKMVVEGVKTAAAAFELAKKENVEMPIVREAYKVLFEGLNPKAAVNNLMLREQKQENFDMFSVYKEGFCNEH